MAYESFEAKHGKYLYYREGSKYILIFFFWMLVTHWRTLRIDIPSQGPKKHYRKETLYFDIRNRF